MKSENLPVFSNILDSKEVAEEFFVQNDVTFTIVGVTLTYEISVRRFTISIFLLILYQGKNSFELLITYSLRSFV